MAAGGYKEFVAGETLDQDEINDYLMQGMLVFAGTAARGSAIGTPVEGQFSFLKDSDTVEFYDGSAWTALSADAPAVEYVVVGGGGGGGRSLGGNQRAGGGGAGGYRSNVSGENSGRNTTADAAFYALGTYQVTIGAGGSGATNGNSTFFAGVMANGGGGGGGLSPQQPGQFGACGGGGGADPTTKGLGIANQGFDGANGGGYNQWGGGGGGAGENGTGTYNSPDGGDGIASSITGSSTYRAGGGGGTGGGTNGVGGLGGGGDYNQNGTANTGGGGGALNSSSGTTPSGGSGVVIFTVPTGTSVTFSGGVTQSSATSGGKDIYTVTATSTTSETVTIG